LGESITGLAGNEFVESLFLRSLDAIMIYDREGFVRQANPAAELLMGATEAEFVETKLGDRLHPDEIAKAREAFDRALDDLTTEFDARLRRGDGSLFDAAIMFIPICSGGKVTGVCGIAREISARKEIERALFETTQKFRSLFEYYDDPVALVDLEGVITAVNAATTTMTGHAPEGLIDRPYTDLLLPIDPEEARQLFPRVAHVRAVSTPAVLFARTHQKLDVLLKAIPVLVDERVVGAYLIAHDLSAERSAERDAREQAERLRSLHAVMVSAGATVLEQLHETLDAGRLLLECDFASISMLEEDELVVRHASGSIAGLGVGTRVGARESFVGRIFTVDDVLIDEDVRGHDFGAHVDAPPDAFKAYIGGPIRLKGRTAGSIAFLRSTEQERFRSIDTDLVRLVGALCASAIERIEHEARLDQLAFTDPLTGLPNRLVLDDRLRHAIATSRRQKQRFALMFLDLDHFKSINDTYGHLVGDAVLRCVAGRLQYVLRDSDTVARIGGDEFIIVQPNIGATSDVFDLSRRLLAAFEKPLVIEDREFTIGVSIGIAIYPDDAADASSLLERADAALYRSKAEGRGRASSITTDS
jgi:diguanylate cyclase (GGDEF)-like protein/PAS domain S-box-containing protein